MAKKYGEYYGKRPMWQWIVIYLVIGGIAYAVIYYFILAPKVKYGAPMVPTYTQPTQTSPTYAAPTTAPTVPYVPSGGGGYRMPGY